MEKVKLSVVILTKNEEAQILECINSVKGWAEEIIVVDDESEDKTVERAKSLGAKVFIKRQDIEGRHRNWAYSKAENLWILSLDADERLSEELKREIKEVIVDTPHSHFAIPFKTYIGDCWIRWGGWYPAPKVRLFRKDKFRYEETEVHPRIITQGSCGKLKGDIIHYSYKNWEDFLNKLNRQTNLEAIKWYKLSQTEPKKAAYKMNIIHALWRGMDRFIRSFFIKRGWRDGWRGFMVAYFSSLYQILSFAKYREMRKEAKSEGLVDK